MMDDYLPDHLQTIKNLADIAQILLNTKNEKYLATILELLFYYAQEVLDKNCIKREKIG